MTHEERVAAVAALGFTERQAEFLVQVMLHSGVCLGRQYCTFAGIVRGQKMVDFFRRLVAERYATPYPCGHNKARVYHVHNVKLYDAIGQRDVRFRKRTALRAPIERLMMLDHVIAHRDFTWLGAEHDKLAHFLTTTSLRREELPRLAFGAGRRRCRPVSFRTSCRSACRPMDAPSVLVPPARSQRRTTSGSSFDVTPNCCVALPAWSIRLLVPTASKAKWSMPIERAFREELATPLHPQVANELRWFYQTADVTGVCRTSASLDAPVERSASPRFRALRKAWLHGRRPRR